MIISNIAHNPGQDFYEFSIFSTDKSDLGIFCLIDDFTSDFLEEDSHPLTPHVHGFSVTVATDSIHWNSKKEARQDLVKRIKNLQKAKK